MGHGMSWSDAKPSTNNKNYTDVIEIQRFTEDWTKIRLIGDVYEIKQHWLPTLKKDGKNKTSFPRLCLKTGDPDANCPYCNARLRTQTLYMSNAIIRDIQEDKPESKKKLAIPEGTEWRVKGDTWWSPVRVVQFPASVAQKIQGYRSLNKDTETGKTYDLNHPKFGRDIIVKIDKSQSGSGMYDIQKEDQTKLNKEERTYLQYNVEEVFNCVETEQEAIETISGVYSRGNFDEDEFDISAIEEVINVTSKKRKKKNDDDDEDIPNDIEDDEDEKPRKKSKKRNEDDDDDLDSEDDELEDDLDDDEDEKPRKKSKKRKDEDEKPRKKGKKRNEDDDEDDDDLDDDEDDDDLDDEDEDEDEKPRKKGKKRKDEDDDDLDDDEDEKPRKNKNNNDDLDDDLDDDEDEKPRKKGKKRKDEDDDDLDDDEDEDEDEKPRKKGKKRKN